MPWSKRWLLPVGCIQNLKKGLVRYRSLQCGINYTAEWLQAPACASDRLLLSGKKQTKNHSRLHSYLPTNIKRWLPRSSKKYSKNSSNPRLSILLQNLQAGFQKLIPNSFLWTAGWHRNCCPSNKAIDKCVKCPGHIYFRVGLSICSGAMLLPAAHLGNLKGIK